MQKKKKVAIIGTNGIPAQYGGFETLAHYLAQELGNIFDITIYCSSIYKKNERQKKFNNSKLIYLPLKANGLQSILYDIISTIHAWFSSDILLILGPAAGFILPLNKIFNKKVIVNHGGLNEWEREKLTFLQKKYAFYNHKIAAKYADANIADNYPLMISLKKSFGIEANIIEYGGDHIKKSEITSNTMEKYLFLGKNYALCLARAQVDNNLIILLNVYKSMLNRNLVIISNWNISEYGEKLKKEFLNFSNIFIIDAVYNKKELDIIRSNASLYIHSHSQCGTAPSLVEAMHYNIPIICFDVETNRVTTENKTYYFKDEESLKKIVTDLNKEELNKVKKSMFELAKKKYTWINISNKYKKLILKIS